MESKAVAQREKPTLPVNATVADMVRYAAQTGTLTPQIWKEMLDIQVGWEKRQAENEFNSAFARMKFPPIHKTKRGANSDYAPYEEIKKIIDPVLESEGFALSFTTTPPDEKNNILVVGTLLHRLGHSRQGQVTQPIGAVSRMMNPNQAMASASTYGMRDCARLMLNLSFIGMDDDAHTFSTIDERQILTLENLIGECKMDAKSVSDFLTWAKVKSVGDILQGEPYQAAFNMLLKKRKQVLEKAKK